MTSDWPPKNGKRALITGITGQDGSYLAELLLSKRYTSCRSGARDVDVIRRATAEARTLLTFDKENPDDPNLWLRIENGQGNAKHRPDTKPQTPNPT